MEWLSDAETAEYIGVSTQTLWRWDNDSKWAHLNFPKAAIINRSKRRKKSELDQWMRDRVGAASSHHRKVVA
ncbi:DNA-binding protein [Bradyrhizobium diazoefficiens]|nr:DNA-binding protein [Bradyrhizobium diazoefficiens]MBR0847192.1 DNA-binding protein [Bradyrhizobium diazoefficiens]